MKKETCVELNFVRAAAMLAVVVLHVTGPYIYAPTRFVLWGMNPAFFLNQIVRFCVPLFILLSGLSLGFSRGGTDWGPFVKKRAAKLLPPYLFWNVLYWAWNLLTGAAQWRGAATGLDFLRSLLLGSAASHLYFIVVIFQLYLLYPLLKRLLDKYPLQLLLCALALSLFVQQAIAWEGRGIVLLPAFLRPYLWKLFPTWIFYFVLGMALHKFGVERLCAWTGRNLPLLAVLTALYGVWYCYESFFSQSIESVKPQLFFYTPLVLLFLLGAGQRLSRFPACARAASFAAGHSQTVFFLHLLVLYPLRHFPFLARGMKGMLLTLALELALSLVLAWVFDGAAARLTRRLRRRGSAGA